MRSRLVLSGWLAIALLTIAFVPAARSAATDTPTVSCAPGERRLYVTVAGRRGNGVQLYCADQMTPSGLIPFAEDRVPMQIGHDRMGNLLVLWHKVPWVDHSGLTIFNATGAILAEHPVPDATMFVDKNRSVAYLFSYRELPDRIYSGTHYAQWETLFRSVGIEQESADVPVAYVADTKVATIDQTGRMLVDANAYAWTPARPGYAAIFDPQKQKVVDSLYAPACAMAAGADGLVYALNCLGELRIFDPRHYRLIRDLKLDVGGPYVGDVNYRGRMAIDATGTVFVSNGKLQTLLRYNRGETKPSATALDVPRIVDLELDSAGNVYALEGGDSAVKSSIRVFSGQTLEQIREYDFGTKVCACDVFGMTIVDP